jgi:hypothetical protein
LWTWRISGNFWRDSRDCKSLEGPPQAALRSNPELCRGKIVGESDFTKLGTNEADNRRLLIDLKNLLSEGNP